MPVYDMNIKYIKPAKYDDMLKIRTIVDKIPETRMEFEYEIYNQNDVLLNKAKTTLIFLSEATQRPIKCPDYLKTLFENQFK